MFKLKKYIRKENFVKPIWNFVFKSKKFKVAQHKQSEKFKFIDRFRLLMKRWHSLCVEGFKFFILLFEFVFRLTSLKHDCAKKVRNTFNINMETKIAMCKNTFRIKGKVHQLLR